MQAVARKARELPRNEDLLLWLCPTRPYTHKQDRPRVGLVQALIGVLTKHPKTGQKPAALAHGYFLGSASNEKGQSDAD